ncbi:related to Thiamine biosynthetic bifunctional enzyme [Saccharomycodes ludwigii]|uniref:Related to Thiamine biosynthetic bifunctional enzyme n=1 Tax=Saccharomycodes ludwigii TaxID=36035 RepID=A0A376B9X1_9ASCO|nr:hypothetical protein SCDLUD_001118 [Saccharomycodes ludwigii]KAH3903478.1 hypothetical protein SCDLUD_001118 [Saccharomycodes ludwigii]SSD60920.1 related to Thiamine biosynthetic bifunctional enzyme [Saccharomycodes ludwigii]
MPITRDQKISYRLYLVTDSSMLPVGHSFVEQVEEALKGGVTIVQLREKNLETGEFIKRASALKKLCEQYNVPLIINDRIDVALAADADGVHVGQDDMPIDLARKLLGPKKILGWSVSKVEEIEKISTEFKGCLDYVGIGPCFPTNTKKNMKKKPMGARGVSKILTALEDYNLPEIRTVAIGGLHPDNLERVILQSSSLNGKRKVDGISVVSEIMASISPFKATENLLPYVSNFSSRNYEFATGVSATFDFNTFHEDLQSIFTNVSATTPLVQHMTNKVHQNFGANVTLAIGGSPIMSEIESEANELASIPNSSLLINTGSVAPLETLIATISAYNSHKRPIVFDPVGYSATSTRIYLNNQCLSRGQYACIKGNAGEMLSLAGFASNMKGVDSGDVSKISLNELIGATKKVAFLFRTVAVCTGKTDIIADGVGEGLPSPSELNFSQETVPVYLVENEDLPIWGCITASGCSLGSVITTLLGSNDKNSNRPIISLVLAAVTLYKEAGLLASKDCKGSASFNVGLIDNLYQLVKHNEPKVWETQVKRQVI